MGSDGAPKVRLEMDESPHLSGDQLAAVRNLVERVCAELEHIAAGDQETLFHARRYVQKRLEFGERSTPAKRKKLKLTLMARQQGKCAECGEPLPSRYSELDRQSALLGYAEENCRLVHHDCHRKEQAARNYS
jgi:hypothetical protein